MAGRNTLPQGEWLWHARGKPPKVPPLGVSRRTQILNALYRRFVLLARGAINAGLRRLHHCPWGLRFPNKAFRTF